MTFIIRIRMKKHTSQYNKTQMCLKISVTQILKPMVLTKVLINSHRFIYSRNFTNHHHSVLIESLCFFLYIPTFSLLHIPSSKINYYLSFLFLYGSDFIWQSLGYDQGFREALKLTHMYGSRDSFYCSRDLSNEAEIQVIQETKSLK